MHLSLSSAGLPQGFQSCAGLASVVLALGDPPELTEAVRSLISQGAEEIVVVSSGGTGAGRRLAGAGFVVRAEGEACGEEVGAAGIRVLERPERLLPGAARNLGIAASRAPFIAFLASDCVAEPGWIEARMRAHRAGAEAVASAVTNLYRRNLAAWTSYVALFHRRMPGTPAERALRYGVSYDRTLFERFGPFREDLRGGEDTELHQRLEGSVELVWAPDVRTAHRHPTTLLELLRDQRRRGARSARAWAALDGPPPRRVAWEALRRVPSSAGAAWKASATDDRPWILAASAVLPLASLAYAAGAVFGAAGGSGGSEAGGVVGAGGGGRL